MAGTLHEDHILFRSYLAEFFLERKIFQTDIVEQIEKHILYSVFFFFFQNHVAYEIMCKNIVELGRPQMTIWRMRIASWIPRATHTHTLAICNTHCFTTVIMVAQTLVSVTLYMFCLPR